MKLILKLLILFLTLTSINAAYDEEVTATDYDTIYEYTQLDSDDDEIIPFTQLCKFNLPMLNHSTIDDEDFCNCDIIPSPRNGLPSVKIDCELSDHVKNLTNKIFHAQKLPLNTFSLILSYQHFSEIPEFEGNRLRHLDMSNNFIRIVKNGNFIQVTSLEHLDLSYNSIAEIESQAFERLQFLRFLDLTSNQLVMLPSNVFKPLTSLETLKLSSNEGFGRILGKDVHDSALTSLHLHLGVTPSLKHIAMDRCNLSTAINLHDGEGLKSINLAFNNISDFSTIHLPSDVEILDLSGNPIWNFTGKSLPYLGRLRELYLRVSFD